MVYPGESSVITRVLLKGRQKGQSEGVTTEAEVQRFEDVTLLALKMDKGARTKECRWPLESGNGKEIDSAAETLEEAWPC